ncbi:unnamed protein product [Orchesella dallaii]|uniref:Odorant receptor n=1 Tax=Orchesella dallaii TaxID=48710 RepID=A0ABP1R5F2_9HEXA
MLTKTTLHYLELAITHASSIGALPYVWNSKSTHPVEITTKSLRKYGIYCTYQAFVLIHLFHQFFQRFFNQSESAIAEICLLFSVITAVCFLCLYSVNFLVKRRALMNLTNGWFSYFQKFKADFVMPWHGRVWKNGCEREMKLVYWNTRLCPLLISFHYLQYPYSPMYIAGYVDHISLPMYFALLPLVFTTVYVFMMSTMCFFFLFAIPAFVICSINPELKPPMGKKSIYRTKRQLRTPDNLVRLHRFFYLTTRMIEDLISVVGIPSQYLSSYTVIACNVCLLKYTDQLGWEMASFLAIVTLVVIISYTTMLWLAAMLFRYSEGYIAAWKVYTNPWGTRHKFMEKVRRSCRPLKITLGGLYYINIKKVLAYVNFIIWGTVRTLLMVNRR